MTQCPCVSGSTSPIEVAVEFDRGRACIAPVRPVVRFQRLNLAHEHENWGGSVTQKITSQCQHQREAVQVRPLTSGCLTQPASESVGIRSTSPNATAALREPGSCTRCSFRVRSADPDPAIRPNLPHRATDAALEKSLSSIAASIIPISASMSCSRTRSKTATRWLLGSVRTIFGRSLALVASSHECGTRCRCTISRICWPNAEPTSAMRPSDYGGTDLAGSTQRRSKRSGCAHPQLPGVGSARALPGLR
jgi:hypothetical protein